jgi:hypothetical protein
MKIQSHFRCNGGAVAGAIRGKSRPFRYGQMDAVLGFAHRIAHKKEYRVTVKAILFDVDNTLVDHPTSAILGISQHLAHLYPQLDTNQLKRGADIWLELEELHMNKYLQDGCTFQEQRRQRVAAMLDALGRESLNE